MCFIYIEVGTSCGIFLRIIDVVTGGAKNEKDYLQSELKRICRLGKN